jgi:hypothetical protein
MNKIILALALVIVGCGSDKALEQNWKSGWTASNYAQSIATCKTDGARDYPSTSPADIETLCTCFTAELSQKLTYSEYQANKIPATIAKEVVNTCANKLKK